MTSMVDVFFRTTDKMSISGGNGYRCLRIESNNQTMVLFFEDRQVLAKVVHQLDTMMEGWDEIA